jgi:hypothetical protein
MAIKPRLDNDGGNSILYFRNIKANYTDSAAYKAAAHTILDDESKYTDHLTEQIHTLSGIADRKYVFVGKAVWAFVISLAILVITVIIYVLKKLIAG